MCHRFQDFLFNPGFEELDSDVWFTLCLFCLGLAELPEAIQTGVVGGFCLDGITRIVAFSVAGEGCELLELVGMQHVEANLF